MKKVRQMILITIVALYSVGVIKAQSPSKIPSSSIFSGRIIEMELSKRAELRQTRKERKEEVKHTLLYNVTNSTIAPEISVDLLANKGIYLFTTPSFKSIPSINVGARIKAGIVITL